MDLGDLRPATERLEGRFRLLRGGRLHRIARHRQGQQLPRSHRLGSPDHDGAFEHCFERGGRYRAALPATHPFAASKVFAAAELAAELGEELRHAVAYGVSHHDLALFKAVDTAVAVQPDERLAQAAAISDWEIIADQGGRRRPLPH